MNQSRFRSLVVTAGFGVAAAALAQAPMLSPEVHSDRSVTFRLKMPGATKVRLSLEGADSIDMKKDADGVWSVTTQPLEPDLYGYSFSVDDTTVLDPQNPLQKPNLIWQSNMVLVPGSQPQPWEVQRVPHGTVHRHFYRSRIIGAERDYFVYTPPGYKAGDATKYPVLYLLHGYSDMASGWTAVGMANVILDNMIAAAKAKPMIIVMPLGYGVPDFASPTGPNFASRELVTRNYDRFRDALLKEIMPQVESSYNALTDKEHRAIAGLSMGGAETLYIGLNNLDKFAYVGAFSSGGLSDDFAAVFPDLDVDKVDSLKEFYIGCGTDDGLIAFNRKLKGWLKDKGVKFEEVETPKGRHTWMVWRRNLIDFARKAFRN